MRCMIFAGHVHRVVNECLERWSRARIQLFNNVMRDQDRPAISRARLWPCSPELAALSEFGRCVPRLRLRGESPRCERRIVPALPETNTMPSAQRVTSGAVACRLYACAQCRETPALGRRPPIAQSVVARIIVVGWRGTCTQVP